jgi:type I restriction enzyme S subunit
MFTWQLSDFLLPLAPLKEQKKVVQRIEECLSYADGAEKATKAALNRVMGMDQSILRKAFRGELVTQDPKR